MDALIELWSRNNGTEGFQNTFGELEKFLILTQHTDQPMAVIGKQIDDLWHDFISCTELYEKYCHRNFGEFIHHRPHTDRIPVPVASFRTFVYTYQEVFGNIPELWFEGAPPEVASFAKGADTTIPGTYRWSGWPGRRAGRTK